MGRAPCCDSDGLKKGPWLPEEDQKLIDFIEKNGPGNWRTLPKKAGLERCGKSCRLRWTNYLRPDIKRGRFTFEEEETIIQLHRLLGNKWSAIAAKLPGRTDNEIKNYWNTRISKRLLRNGIDPVTHTRRLGLLDVPSIFNHPTQTQLNLFRLLSLQSLVNPEIPRLAPTLSTSSNQGQRHGLNFVSQGVQVNQHIDGGELTQSQLDQASFQTEMTHSAPVLNPIREIQPCLNQHFETRAENMVNEQWESTFLQNSEISVRQIDDNSKPNKGQMFSDIQGINDFLMDFSDFKSDNNNKQSLRMYSVMPAPCVSQHTLLSSNSEYPNSSSSSEDEIDSYCQSLMNFEMPFDHFNAY